MFSGSTYTYSQKLTGASGQQVGVAKSFKVYPGDKVKIEAYAKYMASSGSSNLSGFATALLTAFGYSVPGGGETGTARAAVNNWGSVVAGGGGNGSSSYPKAFVNLLVVDKNYNFIDAAWDQINGGEQVGATPKAAHDYLAQEYIAREEGYIYVYVSNENATLVDVYFDDVVVTHTPGNVIQASEFYPFGQQTTNSWTRQNSTGNNFLYNGGTELNQTTQVYDLYYRNYDPALGRMTSIDPLAVKYAGLSPYNYAFNDPVTFSDPSGAEPGMDPVYGYENSWRYDGSSRIYDDVVYNRVIGWSSPPASFASNLSWMYARAGEGITGSGHWAAGLRTPQENFMMMSTRGFMDYYGVAGLSDNDRFSMANQLESNTQPDFMSFEGMKGWEDGVWVRGGGYTTFADAIASVKQAGSERWLAYAMSQYVTMNSLGNAFPYPPSEQLAERFMQSISSKLFSVLLSIYSNKNVESEFYSNLRSDIERLGAGHDLVDDPSKFPYPDVDGFKNPWSNKFDIRLMNYSLLFHKTGSNRPEVGFVSDYFVEPFGNNYDINDVFYGEPNFRLIIPVTGGTINVNLSYQVVIVN